MKFRPALLFPLLFALLAPAFCLAGGPKLPELMPARLAPFDYRTYSDFFENQQGYARLELFLKQELANIKLAELNAKDGFLLSEPAKERIAEIMEDYGSTDPLNDFYRLRQIDPQSGMVDPEGKLYILDALAEIHSRRLVNFKKAERENREAARLYEKIEAMGIGNAPLSDFMNGRRSIYQAFYLRTGKLPEGFRPYPGRIDLVTPHTDAYLAAARKRDFQETGKRIREREAFLKEKLGRADSAEQEAKAFAGGPKLMDRMEAFAASQAAYTPFEKDYFIADQGFRSYLASGDDAYLVKAARYAEQALARKPAKSLAAMEMRNRLLYMAGTARIKNKDPAGCLEHFTAFLAGAEEHEKATAAFYENQKAILNAANQEAIRRQETSATWAKVIGAVAVALGAYSTSQAMGRAQQGAISQGELTAIQQNYANTFSISTRMMQSAQQGLRDAKDRARFQEEAAEHLSPLFLMANRYLDSFELVRFFLDLGRAYEAGGKNQKALESYEEAARIVERQRGTIPGEQQRIRFFAARQELYENMVLLLSRMNRPGEALEYAERARSRAFVDLMAGYKPRFADKARAKVYERETRDRAELDALLSQRNISADQVDFLLKKTQRGIALRAKSPRAAAEDRELNTLVSVRTLSAEEMAKLPGPDAALLEYFLTPDAAVAFLVMDGKISAKILPLPEAEVQKQALAFRRALTRGEDDRREAAWFYQNLVAPFAARTAGRNLVVVPFGCLHALPFHAFLNGERRLFEDAAVSYAPSATVLSFALDKKAPAGGQALVVGDPTSDLPHARREARAVAAMLPGSTLLLEGQGTEQAVCERAGVSPVIHLAAHGIFDPKNPLNSRVLLAGDELTASELFALSLPGSLVVLSTCESAVSDIQGGDEQIGLKRGFLFAGARSLVASLWPVSDEATLLFMTEFYKNLSAMPKSQALREARRATREKYPEPYYWAPFTLTGAWN